MPTPAELANWRLHSLRLCGELLDSPSVAVGWLTAAQSQEFGPAKWGVARRVGPGLTDAEFDRRFASGEVLRTHAMRPTWHFVLPADIRWLQELTGPRVQQQNGLIYRREGLDDGVLSRSTSLLVEALQFGGEMTRTAVQGLLERAGIAVRGLALAYVLMNAELNGVICSGALQGKQHTYALVEERAPAARRLPRDEALAELTRRYFTSHGPATERDFQWWSGLTLGDIRRGLELVGSGPLDSVTIDGLRYWFGESPPEEPATPVVHLLQGYDEYIVGYSQTKFSVLDVSGMARTVRLNEVRNYNGVMTVNGQVAGLWRRTIKPQLVLVEVAPLWPLTADVVTPLQVEAHRLGDFLELPSNVLINPPPTVG